MLKKIKEYLHSCGLIEKVPEVVSSSVLGKGLVDEAIAHYCFMCHKGFTTAHGTKNHKRLKHKA